MRLDSSQLGIMPKTRPAHDNQRRWFSCTHLCLPHATRHHEAMDTEDQARALIGTTVADKYRVLDVLGAGGMGTVYLAEHVFTKRRVALKRMHPQLGRSKLAAERFIRESQAPSAIGHPGIVQVLDGGSQPDGSLYIVHELLEGVSMSEAVERGTLTASAVVQLGIELLSALGAAHAKGIIHRDIKPDNVFIAQDGAGGVSIKLLDFGIASLRDTGDDDKLTRPGAVLGTAQYMSPEQAMAGPVDERSDLWSVGALLYHALSGQLPYPGDSYSAVIYALCSKQHISLAAHRPDLPSALVSVVERALRKPQEERFASAAQMCAELAAVSVTGAGLAEASKPPSGPVAHAEPTRVGGPQPQQLMAAARRSQQTALDAAARPARAAAVLHEAAATPTPPQPRQASGPAFARSLVLAATMLVCTLTWLLVRDRSDTRAAFGQLTAADEPPPGLQAAPSPSAPVLPRAESKALVLEASDHAAPASATASQDGLPLRALTPVLASQQAQLERCLQESVVAQLLAGAERVTPYRLDVSLSVAPSGRVETVEVSGAAPAQLSSCVRDQLLEARFPEAAAPTAFRYPLVLTPTVVGQ